VADLGLGDLAVHEKHRLAAVRWHFGVQPATQPAKPIGVRARQWEWKFPNGAKTYKGYLKTALWKKTRARILERDGHQCQACLAPAECVHHIDYSQKALAGKSDQSLISLCHSCHYKVEHQGAGKIPCSGEELKRQLLNELMLHQVGFSLDEWHQSRRKPKREKEKPRRAAKGHRKAMEARLRSQHKAMGRAADDALKAWRAMQPWERTNYLNSLGGR
jgi:hypothetical protein